VKRTLLNLIVDLAAAVLLLGMIATGYILRFPLPPGTNKSHALWGLTRHCWGSVHFWISAALLTVLLLHVVLHWQWLVSVVAKRLGWAAPSGKRAVQIGLIAVAALAGVSLLLVWITDRSVERITDAELFGVCPPTDSEELASSKSLQENDGNTVLPKVTFATEVSPIFARSCLSCHGPKRSAGGFRVDQEQDFFAAMGEGPLIVRGKSAESPLVAIVSGERKNMPLANRHKLPDADVRVLKAWIDSGAEWPNRR
jgi:uncharacterized membrane protein